MLTYIELKNFDGVVYAVNRSDGWSIPVDPTNTDYTNFKNQINEDRAELQDADGNTMTADDAKAYIATLP